MLKKFISYYKDYRLLFYLDLFFASLIALFDLVLPTATQRIIDVYIPNKNINMIVIIGVLIVVMYAIHLVADYFVNYWGHVMGSYIERDMRRDLFKHYQILPTSFFDKNKTGSLMTRMTSDLRDVSELAHHGPEDLFISLIMLVGSFIILIGSSVKLTLIMYTLLIFQIWFSIRRRKKMRTAFRANRKKIGILSGVLENSISGIRLTKSFTNEEHEINKFRQVNQEYQESWKGAYREMGIFFSANQFMMNINRIACIVFGGIFLVNGEITSGQFMAFILYLNYMMQPIRKLIMFTEQFQNGISGFERFYEIINLESDIDNGEVVLSDPDGLLQFNNVSFKYEESNATILNNFTLSIEPGKKIALVGETGVGKTTVTKLLPRFYPTTEGTISIDGINIEDITLESLRSNIGHVQQDVFIFFGTILDNIRYGRAEATVDEVIEAAKLANIHDFIMSLEHGYETEVGERGVKLSGGQKQRISIARVFLKNPKLLILDEATSALDTVTENYIQESIEKVAANRTTIIVAHRLSTIKNADEILVLTNEGISERGTHDELLETNGVYREMYEANRKGFI